MVHLKLIKNKGFCTMQQMEWLLSVELFVKDLMKLAEEDEDCYFEVYNPTMLRQLKSFFPLKNHVKIPRLSQGQVQSTL